MRNWLKKCLPSPEAMRHKKGLGWLSALMKHHSYLWCLDRGAVARGVGGGLLIAFIPVPMQIILSVFVAFLLRANLPVTFATTLITNPLTFIPFNFLIYQVGAFVSHSNGIEVAPLPEVSFDWQHPSMMWQLTLEWFQALGVNYLIGLSIVSITAAILGYCLVEAIWTISTWWQRRKH